MEINQCPLTPDAKNRMIAEMAHARSTRRDDAGDPVGDWLAAEAELDAALSVHCRIADPGRRLPIHHRINWKIHHIREKISDRIDPAALSRALAGVDAEMRRKAHALPASVGRATQTIREEINGAADRGGYARESLLLRQGERFTRWKDRRSRAFQQWLDRWRAKWS